MSLILCRKEQVEHPFFIEKLGVHICSSQELCYVIYNHPLLVMDDFVDSHLVDFVRGELNMDFLASKLEKWKKSGESSEELLYVILRECGYYSETEINRFRQQMASYRKMHPADLLKSKADYLFRLGQYGKAISCYESLLEFSRDHFVDDGFLGRVWNNLGSAYARMFRTDKAFQAFDKAYGFDKDIGTIQKMYFLTVLNPKLVLKDRYKSMVTDELKAEWDGAYEKATERASNSDSVKALEELFQKDSIKRISGAAKLVRRWKQEYRGMI